MRTTLNETGKDNTGVTLTACAISHVIGPRSDKSKTTSGVLTCPVCKRKFSSKNGHVSKYHGNIVCTHYLFICLFVYR